MRRTFWWMTLVIAASLIQSTWLDVIRIAGVLPDLPLLLVVYFAIVEGEERAMFTGVIAGLIQDVATDVALGHHVLCLVLVGYAAGRIATRLIADHPAVKAGLVFLASFTNGLIYTLILYVQQPDIAGLNKLAASVIPGAFYTTLVTPVIFFLLDRSLRRNPAAPSGVS
ncbi:MAG: rod shape-determining protein MreD [Candidatus Hydrogenedentes bacterium]|nr:rod shape-determining protein MreD [Candidatus Hydrogenedentota bacterium]